MSFCHYLGFPSKNMVGGGEGNHCTFNKKILKTFSELCFKATLPGYNRVLLYTVHAYPFINFLGTRTMFQSLCVSGLIR